MLYESSGDLLSEVVAGLTRAKIFFSPLSRDPCWPYIHGLARVYSSSTLARQDTEAATDKGDQIGSRPFHVESGLRSSLPYTDTVTPTKGLPSASLGLQHELPCIGPLAILVLATSLGLPGWVFPRH